MAQAVISGNNTEAVRQTNPDDYLAPEQRGYRIVKQSNNESTAEYIERGFQQIGSEAVARIGQLVQSRDERIATKNSHYVVDQIRGKAVTRNISVTGKLNIQSVLD